MTTGILSRRNAANGAIMTDTHLIVMSVHSANNDLGVDRGEDGGGGAEESAGTSLPRSGKLTADAGTARGGRADGPTTRSRN